MKVGDLVKHKKYPYVGTILRKGKTSFRDAWIVYRADGGAATVGPTTWHDSQRIRCWWADDLEVISESG